VKKRATLISRSGVRSTETMPEVLIALATGAWPAASSFLRSVIKLRMRAGVSSLCSSSPCAAWRISSECAACGPGHAACTRSHCVASGIGMFKLACSACRRYDGMP
jgi:hypothetical protein